MARDKGRKNGMKAKTVATKQSSMVRPTKKAASGPAKKAGTGSAKAGPAKKAASRPAKKAASRVKRAASGAVKKAASRGAKKAATRGAKKAATPLGKRTLGSKAPARKAALRPPRKTSAKKAARPVASHSKSEAKPGIRREDRPGHLNPRYVAQLREQSGEPERGPRAFIDSPRSPKDDLAEELGEETVERATSGEDEEEALEQVVPEEQGGPFVETNAAQEFAQGLDASNPRGAKREPFPRT
jgi:hypothetical protein